MNIGRNITEIKRELPPEVVLVAVSKFHPTEAILEAYDAGQRVFGESKVQELTAKYEVLPKDIEWHFIGHLQSNKVKYIAPFIDTIHSIDSLKLLEEVNLQASRAGRTINVLLQIHIACESTKFGFSFDECRDFLLAGEWRNCSHTRICGLMGMATFTDNEQQIRSEYDGLSTFFHEIKQSYFPQEETFRILSMGMSDDYPIAIAAGSTCVRIGTHIFGERA